MRKEKDDAIIAMRKENDDLLAAQNAEKAALKPERELNQGQAMQQSEEQRQQLLRPMQVEFEAEKGALLERIAVAEKVCQALRPTLAPPCKTAVRGRQPCTNIYRSPKNLDPQMSSSFSFVPVCLMRLMCQHASPCMPARRRTSSFSCRWGS